MSGVQARRPRPRLSHTPRSYWCPDCDAETIAFIWEGFAIQAGRARLTPLGELQATIAGIQTYALGPDYAFPRFHEEITYHNANQLTVVAEHRCVDGVPLDTVPPPPPEQALTSPPF